MYISTHTYIYIYTYIYIISNSYLSCEVLGAAASVSTQARRDILERERLQVYVYVYIYIYIHIYIYMYMEIQRERERMHALESAEGLRWERSEAGQGRRCGRQHTASLRTKILDILATASLCTKSGMHRGDLLAREEMSKDVLWLTLQCAYDFLNTDHAPYGQSPY